MIHVYSAVGERRLNTAYIAVNGVDQKIGLRQRTTIHIFRYSRLEASQNTGMGTTKSS